MLTHPIDTVSAAKNGLGLALDGTGNGPATVPARSFSSALAGLLMDTTTTVARLGAALQHLDRSLARQANAATSVLSMLRNRYEDRRRWRAYQRNIARWKLAGV